MIITLDADFHAILALESALKPSVVRIRIESLKGSDLAELIEKIWPSIEKQLEHGAVVSITERSIRIKNLPI